MSVPAQHSPRGVQCENQVWKAPSGHCVCVHKGVTAVGKWKSLTKVNNICLCSLGLSWFKAVTELTGHA